MTPIAKPAMPCAACAGKGWLPLRLDALPVAGWIETLCRECGGGGIVAATPQAEAA